MSYCQYCDGKLKTIAVVHDTENNEIYRKKKCLNCNRKSYTMEFEVEETQTFLRTFRHWATQNTYAIREKKKNGNS